MWRWSAPAIVPAIASIAITTMPNVTLRPFFSGVVLDVLPQIDGRLAWRFKRAAPSLYARTVGEAYRLFAG